MTPTASTTGTRSAVFIVDDDASVRDAVRSLLRSVGLDAGSVCLRGRLSES